MPTYSVIELKEEQKNALFVGGESQLLSLAELLFGS
jgi:hypothetical protein